MVPGSIDEKAFDVVFTSFGCGTLDIKEFLKINLLFGLKSFSLEEASLSLSPVHSG